VVRPSLFVGSSTESLDAARAVRSQLADITEGTVWDEGLFQLSRSALDSLLDAVPRFRFAILVLTPDDVTTSRGRREMSARDNVIFESGLCLGSLRRDWTFLVFPRDASQRIPSDLRGITMAPYTSDRRDGNVRAAVGEACDLIRDAITKQMEAVESSTARAAWKKLGNESGDRLTVWALGSYQGLEDHERLIASRVSPLLGSALAQAGARLVVGESDLLWDMVEAYRDANLSNADWAPNPIVLPGRLRGKDMEIFFRDAIGRVPEVAIVLGGGIARGRVQAEIKGAKEAGIVILPVRRCGGFGARVRSNRSDLMAPLSRLGPRSDAAEIAGAILQALSSLRGN
jgi:hypothetical protein